MTRRALTLAAVFAAGLVVALLTLSPPATAAGISCATNSAAEVAAASVTDLGNGWSQPGQGDLWDVNMADLAYDVSVYAQDAAGARVAAKAALDQQIATLGCGTTTSTTAQTTTAPPVTVTTTLPAQTVTTTQVAPLWLPAQTVTTTATTTVTSTVTTPAPKSQPINVTVNVGAKKCKAAKAVKTKR